MKRKMMAFMMALLAAVMLFPMAKAFTPTPTPSPTPPRPTEPPSSIMGTFQLYVDTGSGMRSVSTVMRYARSLGMYADGTVFMSDTDYSERPMFGHISQCEWTGALQTSLSCDDGVTGSTGITLYRCENGEYTVIRDAELLPEKLGEGTYLLAVNVNINRQSNGDYYSGTGYLWLNVSKDCTDSQEKTVNNHDSGHDQHSNRHQKKHHGH